LFTGDSSPMVKLGAKIGFSAILVAQLPGWASEFAFRIRATLSLGKHARRFHVIMKRYAFA
jgi:hypothetical protein